MDGNGYVGNAFVLGNRYCGRRVAGAMAGQTQTLIRIEAVDTVAIKSDFGKELI
jgi:hypothetical protein